MKKFTLIIFLNSCILGEVYAQNHPFFKDPFSQISWQQAIKVHNVYPIDPANSDNDKPLGTLAEKPRLDSTVFQEYDRLTKSWSPVNRIEYNYDLQWRPQTITSVYYELGVWVPFVKEEHNFDLFNRLSTIIRYKYNQATSLYSKAYYEEFYYDTSGKLKESYNSYWDTTANNWQTDRKLSYSYDVNGKLIIEIREDFDLDLNKWVYDSKVDIDYNGAGRMSKVYLYYFDETTNNWSQGLKEEYGFNAQGNVDLLNRYIWNENDTSWNDYGSSEFSYDSKGNLIQEEATGIESEMRYIFGYQIDVPLKEVIGPSVEYYQQRFKNAIHNQVTKFSRFEYDNDNMTWVTKTDMTYYYSTQTTGRIENITSGLSIFPNPSEGTLFLSKNLTGSFMLYDVSGQVILTLHGDNFNQIELNHISKGLYFYQITGDNQVYKGKLILR